jgi:hypothetical protein
MARAKRVVADVGSAELDELRRQFNNLLVLLETAADLGAIQTALTAGTVTGVQPTPLHPTRPSDGSTVVLNAASDF